MISSAIKQIKLGILPKLQLQLRLIKLWKTEK